MRVLIYFAQLGTHIIAHARLGFNTYTFCFLHSNSHPNTHISSLSAPLFVSAMVVQENLLSAWTRLPKCSHPEKTLTEPGTALWASPGFCPIILLPHSHVSLPTAAIDASFPVWPAFLHSTKHLVHYFFFFQKKHSTPVFITVSMPVGGKVPNLQVKDIWDVTC